MYVQHILAVYEEKSPAVIDGDINGVFLNNDEINIRPIICSF